MATQVGLRYRADVSADAEPPDLIPKDLDPPAASDPERRRLGRLLLLGHTRSIAQAQPGGGSHLPALAPSTEFQFGDGIEKYADLEECNPKCTVDRGLGGGYYLTLPGVKPGKEVTFTFQWLPTKVGVSNWSVCVYDDAEFGEQVGCYDATTTIRA